MPNITKFLCGHARRKQRDRGKGSKPEEFRLDHSFSHRDGNQDFPLAKADKLTAQD
jgi:hypothetical protein